jgi:hypothetical protein
MSKTLLPLPIPDGDTWVLRANRKPPGTVVLPHSVLAGLLLCLADNPSGVTLDECEAAVQRVVRARRLKGKHPVLTLMRWAAPNRGIEFACASGVVTCKRPSNLDWRR